MKKQKPTEALEYQQWACQMPNVKYIWHIGLEYTQQLDG